MVSTHTQQYITDFVPNTADGKSPLAMLAKTCETIGLPDVPLMKKSPALSSDGKSSMGASPDLSLKGKSESPNDKKRERCSPRATPSTSKSEPLTSTSMPALTAVGKAPFGALGFHTAFPFYPGATMMNPFAMHTAAFPGFGMAHAPQAYMNARVPCPAAIMRQPCITPGCSTCSTPGPSATDMFANPLFSAYAAMMPTVSGASGPAGISSYQALLASAAAAASANAAAVASCTPSVTTPTPGSVSSSCSSSSHVKHTCSWMDSTTGMCGKQFATTDELTNHMKNHAIASVNISSTAPSPVPSSSSSVSMSTPDKISNGKMSSSAGNTPNMRFNPYGKSVAPGMMAPAGAAVAAAAAAAAGMPSMTPMAFNPMALHAMYAQRMMTMPHP
ncbi:unnamed protein product [Auanema sp. JU1783]|nr:unnamed protein product [Auanema sp. JU1783]